jgi:hypothetical protein
LLRLTRRKDGLIVLWRGNPDSQAAHDWLLDWLRNELKAAFRTQPLNNRILGNLGECMAHMLGSSADFAGYHSYAANAIHPLENISRPGIDILWYFPGADADGEMAIIQEVKTTSDASLALADSLVDDTDKLFGNDVQKTLQTRLNAAAAEFKLARRQPEFAQRVRLLGGPTAGTASRVHLVPTLVHEEIGADPQTKLTAVRTSIVSLGWDPGRVVPWSVALEGLWNRLERVSHGHR